jgi:hypothetical protein
LSTARPTCDSATGGPSDVEQAHGASERQTPILSEAEVDRRMRDDDHGRPVPIGVDPKIPSPARMYDYYLGGKTNYATDREAADKALRVVPSGRQLARANRYFLMRAVRLMADQGISQFIDLGTGLPTSPNVHELARAIHPAARVLYVDNDAVVAAHGRALLTTSDGLLALQADIREPDSILNSPELAELIDFGRPVGVLFVAVLHFIEDRESPHGIVRAFTSRMAAGSYLALSHITSDGTDAACMAAIRDAYACASAPAVFRDEAEIRAFYSGFEVLGPGLAEVARWSPGSAAFPAEASTVRFLAGIGRKAGPAEQSGTHDRIAGQTAPISDAVVAPVDPGGLPRTTQTAADPYRRPLLLVPDVGAVV